MSIQSIAHSLFNHLRPKRTCTSAKAPAAVTKAEGAALKLTALSSTADRKIQIPLQASKPKAKPTDGALTAAFADLLGKTKLNKDQIEGLMDVFVASSGIHRLDSAVRPNYRMSDFTRDPSASNFRSVDITEKELTGIRSRVLRMPECSAKADLLEQLEVFTGMLKHAERALDIGLGAVTGRAVLQTADMPDFYKSGKWLNVQALAHTLPRNERAQMDVPLQKPSQMTATPHTKLQAHTCTPDTVINWEAKVMAMR